MTGKLCFLLGIMPRSGTNFFASLLECHDEIAQPGPLWEDFFLSQSDKLLPFVHHTRHLWHPRWDPQQGVLSQTAMMASLGQGLVHFIERQRTPETMFSMLVQKTPTVRNLAQYSSLFPEHKLLLLVRDGRSVVCSGEKSFGWQFEQAAREWAKAAKAIHCFVESEKSVDLKIVRYEDLYLNRKETLTDVFLFLGLDPDACDWQATESLAVHGSSDTKDSHGEVTWQVKVQPTEDFKPLQRYQQWPKWKRVRFEWLAGLELEALGYRRTETAPYPFVQRVLDVTWPVRMLPKVGYELLKNKRFILKSH